MNFGILIFDEVEELDFVGPWEMLTMWSMVADGPSNCLVVAQSPGPLRQGLVCQSTLLVLRLPAA
jgi:hypothetical protein